MTERERVMAVYRGQIPDQVPLMLDLSHWYKANFNKPFDLSGYKTVEMPLVELHRKAKAACYCEMGTFYKLASDTPEITVESRTEQGVFITEIRTPLGSLHEERVFSPESYSYNIRKHLLESVDDFPIVEMLMEHLVCTPVWERYVAWAQALGEWGFPYAQLPYSGLGYLISRNFGVEPTIYAHLDHPDDVARLNAAVNSRNLAILDAIIDGPFNTLIISDNLDSNVQTRELFDAYSRGYYTEVASRLHAKGKFLAVHVDGEMRGALQWMSECGVDCVDAATPAPMFSLTPGKARAQAGTNLILSGGIPATVFGSTGTDEQFVDAVKRWLDLRHLSPRLIMAAGDQVPTDAPWYRVELLRELVDEFGRY
jgi:hypothetical protein